MLSSLKVLIDKPWFSLSNILLAQLNKAFILCIQGIFVIPLFNAYKFTSKYN